MKVGKDDELSGMSSKFKEHIVFEQNGGVSCTYQGLRPMVESN
jgi:hypothetical protein